MYLTQKHKRIVSAFRKIDPVAYREKVRFFETHKKGIYELDKGDFIEMISDYGDSLFELGKYERFCSLSDELLTICLDTENELYLRKRQYLNTLFKKAASRFQQHRTSEAETITRQLIRLDPGDKLAKGLLARCIFRRYKGEIQMIRAATILLIISAAALTGIQLLVIDNFFEDWSGSFVLARNILFLAGIITLIFGFLIFKGVSWLKAEKFSAVQRHNS